MKKILTDSQDRVLKRVQDLKGQIEAEKAVRNEMESQLLDKDSQISILKNQVILPRHLQGFLIIFF